MTDDDCPWEPLGFLPTADPQVLCLVELRPAEPPFRQKVAMQLSVVPGDWKYEKQLYIWEPDKVRAIVAAGWSIYDLDYEIVIGDWLVMPCEMCYRNDPLHYRPSAHNYRKAASGGLGGYRAFYLCGQCLL